MRILISLLVLLSVLAAAPAGAGPEGQMTLVLNISTAARWFDPSESEGLITPFIFYFMIHDALVKPMPGNPMAVLLSRGAPRPTGTNSEVLWGRRRSAHDENTISRSIARVLHAQASRREDPHSKSALEGKRKHVTVLFADLKGSMEC